MAKHTPGPWIADGRGIWHEAGMMLICQCSDDHDEFEANRSLIAAAPDMAKRIEELEEINRDLRAACKKAHQVLDIIGGERKHTSEAFEMLKAAIAKAEGGV